MKRRRTTPGAWQVDLIESSPLRPVDPRTKLALSLSASLAVMLPLTQLVVAILIYIAFMGWARVLKVAARQVWGLKWLLLGLFVIDWIFVSLELAVSITLRLSLLASTFSMFFATTTPAELRLALEWMRVPYRYAFSLSLAFQSLSLLDEEWRTIREAQQARGAWQPPTGWRKLRQNISDMIALSVPAIVLVTKRAWAMTEAAYARGFDAPHRRPYRELSLKPFDWALLIGATLIGVGLMAWRLVSI
ncbi:MAG TPA: energy-coupling factor transporter transmembrane component T [Aggregatilineales bacterium]|nr:energy-coupling factor transporter transmembrane protein EcfT [Chloroflexota bacterium]HOA25659.1 energy-coupling factor transporter transmembrane component T [Aggregatilineales bacterium]HPV07304.1 energy-coupling factor transporter transmembrane component T [Aggregatilineales bacterium]HQA69001.1 energy-coupling factor transporter transmembrane component T [Aggregatilineales bacterium]HQE18317.1 energy-coupling factor transporter transmembrane component T [Aggregatilineales bacterium]